MTDDRMTRRQRSDELILSSCHPVILSFCQTLRLQRLCVPFVYVVIETPGAGLDPFPLFAIPTIADATRNKDIGNIVVDDLLDLLVEYCAIRWFAPYHLIPLL